MAQADYEIAAFGICRDQKFVFLIDLNLGHRSATNDAENVVAEVLAQHPTKRIAYCDSAGDIAELLHNGAAFIGFGPWPPQLP